MKYLGSLEAVNTGTMDMQVHADISDNQELVLSQETCIDGWVIRDDYITLSRAQVAAFLDLLMAYIENVT